MRVDDVEPAVTHEPVQGPERADIGHRPNRPDERRNVDEIDSRRLGPAPQAAFASIVAADDERDLERGITMLPDRRVQRVFLRAAENQACDDVSNANRAIRRFDHARITATQSRPRSMSDSRSDGTPAAEASRKISLRE